jgi:large subunit ribosomal protein L10
MSTKAQKISQQHDLEVSFAKAQAVILTEYRGFTVKELAAIRNQLRPQDVRYMVAKNTLIRRAADHLGFSDPGVMLDGPTALAFLNGSIPAPARIFLDLSRARKPMPIKGAIVSKRFMGPEVVAQFTTMPPLEVIHAQVVGGIAAPLSGLVGVLQASVASLGYLLQARITQLGSADGATPA